MAIQKWDPIREMERLHDEFDRLFRPQGNRAVAMPEGQCPLAVDILETVEEVLLRAELPGVKAEDVNVKIEDEVLTLSGEKKFSHDEKKETYLRVERYYGSFSRSFTLPNYVDAGKISAEARDGVLTIHLPKRPETKPRQIQVKVA